jgi:hypothetical protein
MHTHEFRDFPDAPCYRRCVECAYLQILTGDGWRTASKGEIDRFKRERGDTWSPARFLPQGLTRYGHPRVRRHG